MKKTIPVLLPVLLAGAMSCPALAQIEPKPAEPATVTANAAFSRTLPATDAESDAGIHRGFIASVPAAQTLGSDGKVIYSLKGFEFLQAEKGPATVNPSLWIQARKMMAHGLYKVTDGFYQVR